VRLCTSLDGREVTPWIEDFLGIESATFDHAPKLEEVMPRLRTWMAEVADRRA
jgi:hypothetical protein